MISGKISKYYPFFSIGSVFTSSFTSGSEGKNPGLDEKDGKDIEGVWSLYFVLSSLELTVASVLTLLWRRALLSDDAVLFFVDTSEKNKRDSSQVFD